MCCPRYQANRSVGARICRQSVLAAVLLLAATTFAWAAEPVSVQVLEDTGWRIVLDYKLGDFTDQPVIIDGRKYSLIALGTESLMQKRGGPALPNVCRSVIIPDDARMVVKVVDAKFYDIPDVLVAPSKGVILRTQNPDDVPWTFGDVYNADAFYPGELATLREPYILRDYRGVVVEVNPLQYNPVTGTLRVYTNLTVEVVSVGPGQVNVLEGGLGDGELSLAFHRIYKGHFVNYDPGLRYDPLDETGDMLIICYDSWLTNIQPLVDHKNAIGLNTTAVGVSTIGNNATSIKSHIQNVYDTSDLAFVLLVGDAPQVDTPYAAGGSADPTYSLLAGGDHYPDVMVGRFSAQAAAQVDTQVLRTIEYELNEATQEAWFWKGVGIASAQGAGQGDDGEADWQHMNNIRTDLLGYGYTEVDQIYDTTGATASMVSTAVNAGRGIINYCGHGTTHAWNTTGFSTSYVNALVNDNMLPFIISVACLNGQFNGYTCFAEAWLRATNGAEPTGAIGIYASSINQSWAPPMCGQDEVIDRLVAEDYFSFGALCFAGSCQMMVEYGYDGRNMFDTWHVFGDPSVRVVGTVTPPSGLEVAPDTGLDSSGSRFGPFTPDSIEYTLENIGDASFDYSVTKTVPWLTVTNSAGTLTAYATATVTVSINSAANMLDNGYYEDTVYFTNTTDGKGDTTRTVNLQVGGPELAFSFPMDTDPGWTTEGLWAFGQPIGGGGENGGPDPTSGNTGDNVYGYNLNGDYENYLSQRHLTSTALNCGNLTGVTLKFWRWLGVEQSPFDRAYLLVSNDGSNWTTIWQNSDEVADSSWVLEEYDISSVADDQPTVYLRWTMGATDSSGRYCGWNIDDVEIWAIVPSAVGVITGTRSCLTHDTAGELCADLDAINIEPRQPGVQKLEFDLSDPAAVIYASVDCTPDPYNGTPTVTADGSTLVTVEFDPPLPNRHCCDITLTGDAHGTVTVRPLVGDVNRSAEVNTTDASQIKMYFGQSANTSNCVFDYNCSGAIDTTDASQIKLSFGNASPACP